MMRRILSTALTATLLLVGTGRAETETSGQLGNVTQARVLAERDSGENWLVNGGTFTGDHYSPLAQITDDNVAQLGLAWATDVDSPTGLSADGSGVGGRAPAGTRGSPAPSGPAVCLPLRNPCRG